MMFVEFNVDNKSYKLRLNVRNTISLEKQLGKNPIGIFGKGDEIPTITTMVQILYASLQQYQHGITLDDAYDIFEKWLEEGHAITDFLAVIIDVYKTSGILKADSKTEEKN